MEFEPFIKQVKGRWGIYLVNPNDQYVGASLLDYGEFSEGEPALWSKFVESRMFVVEVGANIGALTLPLARLVGPRGTVLALEPQRSCFQMLCGTMALNGITNVTALPVAAGSQTGHILMPRLDPLSPNNFGGLELGHPATITGEQVFCYTLDDLLHALGMTDKWVDFLKIDVEGMEGEVLAGAERILTTSHPILYVENDRPDRSDALIARIKSYGYDCWFHMPTLFNTNNYAKKHTNRFGEIVSINMICLPAGDERARGIPADCKLIP